MNSDGDKAIGKLLATMEALRDPDTGCPWDIKQTFASIAPYTIEEAYEVADAIERGGIDDLKDELGDLLLQVVYHARIAEELQHFKFFDVAEAINAKLIRRHPHVFGPLEQRRSGSIGWDAIKQQEKQEKVQRTGSHSQSIFDDIPAGLPAMQRSTKIQKCAANIGFDWHDISSILDKIDEELQELRNEITDAAYSPEDEALQKNIVEEYGDLLFVLVNLGRHLNADAETALRGANQKFLRRFASMQKQAEARGEDLSQLSPEALEALWAKAKAAERLID